MASVSPADAIVPTPVGVNRVCPPTGADFSHCPHARGGEPIREEK